jgi:hypothetical protein
MSSAFGTDQECLGSIGRLCLCSRIGGKLAHECRTGCTWLKLLGRAGVRSPRRLCVSGRAASLQWLVLCADSGVRIGHRNRLWKLELQKFAKETGFTVRVCHDPRGTSKWNKIEHCLFCPSCGTGVGYRLKHVRSL